MPDIELGCRCRTLRGYASGVTPELGNRLACCCVDCQAFAQYLGDESRILDEYGATDIIQLPVSCITISDGIEQLACLRLTEKGLNRWYARCCNTPIGNTLGPGAPFIGLIHSFIPDIETKESIVGRNRGHIQLKGAQKFVPRDKRGSARTVFRSLTRLLVWKLRGLDKPTVFFDADGKHVVEPIVLTA